MPFFFPFCVFQKCFIIKNSIPYIYFYHGHYALSPLSLPLKGQAVNQSHTFFVSSSRASPKQGVYHLSSHCCMYTKLFFCLLLKAPLSFHDLTVSARTHISHFTAVRYQHVKTERHGKVCYFFCFFSYRREIWFFLSATQSEVQSQFSLSSLCRSLSRTQDGWWLAIHCKPDFSQANCFPVWHSCLSKGFKLSIYTVIKKLLSSVSAILHSDYSSENSLLPLRCKMYHFNVVKVPACNIAKSI